jgi:hypothetical protein
MTADAAPPSGATQLDQAILFTISTAVYPSRRQYMLFFRETFETRKGHNHVQHQKR